MFVQVAGACEKRETRGETISRATRLPRFRTMRAFVCCKLWEKFEVWPDKSVEGPSPRLFEWIVRVVERADFISPHLRVGVVFPSNSTNIMATCETARLRGTDGFRISRMGIDERL